MLTRSRLNGSGKPSMLLRAEVQADSEAEVEEEVADLLTDLRLLGLRPTLASQQQAV